MRRSSWKLRHAAEPGRELGRACVLVMTFAVLALVTRMFCLDPNQSTAFWPANGALVVAMLLLTRRTCLVVLAVCFCLNIALNLLTSYTAYASALYSVLNIVSSCLVALQTRRWCGATTDLTRFRRLATFAVIAFLSAAIEAAIGEILGSTGVTASAVLADWLQWTLCDGFGFLLSTPAILLSIKHMRDGYECEANQCERWTLLVSTVAVTAIAFLLAHSPLFLLIYPLVILTAFRAGPAWVLASTLIAAIISSGLTAHGFGPLAFLSSGNAVVGQQLVQPFLISIFLAAVPANNALGEKRRATRRLLQMKAFVEHTATHDGLTTLVNRALFQRQVRTLLWSGSKFALLFIDLDRFKLVNDTMGHGAGDELLRAFSLRLLEVAGPDATVARFGGDEFAVLTPQDTPAFDPEDLCRRVAEVARQPFLLGRGPTHMSASIGVAFACGEPSDASELMRKADIALYAAKAAGRNGFKVFSDDLGRIVCDRADLEADLRDALREGGQLELHYQSKVDVNGVVRGVEALVRWHHPAQGLIPPGNFIAIAEETGLIIPLGEWVLCEALAFAARWPKLNISINVSPVQLRYPGFVAETLRAHGRSQVSYGRLELEVTETALMDDLSVVCGNLAALRAAGIRIALDDFGTGYSSLRHLHRCAVDRVKIDQSFVSGLNGSSEAAAIIKAVIQLGHAMGLQVTAEGVESEAQRKFLVNAGIDELQGFLFSKPIDERDFTRLMSTFRTRGTCMAAADYLLIQGGLQS